MQVLAAAEALTISTAGAWTEVDLTGAPYSVPTTATFALLHVVLKKTTAPAATFQVRSSASAQATYGAPESPQDYTATVMSVVAPLSAGKFDYYSNATTAGGTIEVAVIGYFSALDGVSFNTSIDITPADPGLPSEHPLLEGWETIDVSAYVPSTFNMAVCSYHDAAFETDLLTIDQDAIRHSFDIRVTGGSAVISETADQYTGNAAGSNSTQYFIAPLGSLGKFDIYGYAPRNSAAVSRTLLLHGYLKGTLNGSPLTTDDNTHVAPSSSAWLERSTSATGAKAALIYFANNASWNAVLGYRMKGELGAHTTAMESTEVVRGIQQGLVALDTDGKWEEWEEYSGTYSGTRSFTIAYFLSEELVEESITATDVLVQDLYTREISESSTVTDTLVVGDTHDPDTIAESSTATDTLVSDMARGAVVNESTTVTDTILGVAERASASGEFIIDFLAFDGDGLTGYAGEDSIYIPEVALDATGLWGALGTNASMPVDAIIDDSDGLFGDISIGAASLLMPTSILGTGAHGNVGSATGYIVISTTYATPNTTGFIATDGNNYVYIDITSTTIGASVSGSGTLYLPVSLYSDIVNRTGFRLNESTWAVYPVNIPLAAVSRYDRQYAGYAVSGGKPYAVVGGNIYRLGERTDAGTAIAAIIAKSAIDGGSSHRKIATDIFMRLMSEGNFTVNVSADRGSGQITIVDNLQRKHGSKGDLPKGVIGREFAFNVHNVDGAYFEIDEIELIMALSEGRRGRQTHG